MKLVAILEECGDVYVEDYDDEIVHLDFNDFEGFDEDWSEIMRPYEREDLVNKVFDILEKCPNDNGFYCTYMVENHPVKVGYASYDI